MRHIEHEQTMGQSVSNAVSQTALILTTISGGTAPTTRSCQHYKTCDTVSTIVADATTASLPEGTNTKSKLKPDQANRSGPLP